MFVFGVGEVEGDFVVDFLVDCFVGAFVVERVGQVLNNLLLQ